MGLKDFGIEVGEGVEGVVERSSGGVLEHDGAVFVVGIGEGESIGGEVVEEGLFGTEVVVDGEVVVEVVTGEVGEDGAMEVKSGDA